ncbi:hypothetical protein CRE_10696 [Caenorhabditis remanei]|uniref:DUF19 domain-containing protein n=1 Tax=Caenorhabditis remanei TaxID=31234 RepID=E3NL68_CAERE|nr:hypothetical protein CRE_10696 [Caenorhabditis remanei]
MFLFLLVLVPVAISGLDSQCVEEFHKMLGCVKNRTLFSRIYDLGLDEEWMDRNLAEEIGNAISCSSMPTCLDAEDFYRLLLQEKWTIDFYHSELKSCLGNGTLKEIKRICNSIPRPPSDDLNPCQGIEDPCLSEELVKQKTCTDAHLPDFKVFSFALHTECVSLHVPHLADKWKEYSIDYYRSS